jgi:RNase P subunit RPR2
MSARRTEEHTMAEVWGACASCDTPLVYGLKLNVIKCDEHPGCYLALCDACADELLHAVEDKEA